MNCKKCHHEFEITAEDQAFYQTINVTPPTHCPDCRQKRRLAWRNERVLYKRKCDGTGEDILSVFSEDKPYKIYNPEYWYSDKWDAKDYGRDFDFNRPFFEQFQELMLATPQIARSVVNIQNCDYINQAGDCKNCYLLFEGNWNENCYYSSFIYHSRSCADVLQAINCELCYECVNCNDSYNLKYSQDSENCSDSLFLKNCIGCRNCFGCVNLRNKEYYFLNQKCTPEEYNKKLSQLDLKNSQSILNLKASFNSHVLKFPHKYYHGTQNENSIGDYLYETKNCQHCFDTTKSQDSKYLYNCANAKKCYDITVFGDNDGMEFCCDSHEIGIGVRNVYFSDQVWGGCYDIYYSKLCLNNCHHLFGCVSMKHASYCIFNKQYTPEEYESLKNRIIEHMKKTGEYGEFFPAEMSPFKYEETVSGFYYPEDNAGQTNAVSKKIKSSSVSENIHTCKLCANDFKIIPMEAEFYKKMSLPHPDTCGECRYKERFKLRTPRQIHERQCGKCQASLKTPYSPERPEIIYCEKCYQESVE